MFQDPWRISRLAHEIAATSASTLVRWVEGHTGRNTVVWGSSIDCRTTFSSPLTVYHFDRIGPDQHTRVGLFHGAPEVSRIVSLTTRASDTSNYIVDGPHLRSVDVQIASRSPTH